ncbi:MAG TPA: outer membrane beta-barrel protein [Chitinophagaceae bacterium]|nr:outer membrane beta-barrel protein [Chitinophagaceae bacterium]HPH30985.1 outer membrane beta-barrel protein [Chitinophagaceae bacterium]HPN58828.1 outer membrane beta-barrel protein [Chitinophagaceae bacterium]
MNRIILIVLLFAGLTVSAQNQVALFAGPQMSTANYSIRNQKQETGFKYGLHAGIGMKVPFDGFLYFAPSVYYSYKGYDVTYNLPNSLPDIDAIDNSTRFHTMELAALLQFDLSPKPSHVFIKAGPALDFMLFAKEKFNLSGGGSVSRNMKFGPGEYGRYSANLISQLGYEKDGGFIVYFQFTHSPANLSNRDGGPSIKHKVFGLTFGKYLNRKKIIIDTRVRE